MCSLTTIMENQGNELEDKTISVSIGLATVPTTTSGKRYKNTSIGFLLYSVISEAHLKSLLSFKICVVGITTYQIP